MSKEIFQEIVDIYSLLYNIINSNNYNIYDKIIKRRII